MANPDQAHADHQLVRVDVDVDLVEPSSGAQRLRTTGNRRSPAAEPRTPGEGVGEQRRQGRPAPAELSEFRSPRGRRRWHS
ncbi:hypothetical protein CL689_01280 [Candidatus Saccharibacteria bacterium]|nr:hypothetical protein [Candidatus Saccharibacteria bacterium]